MKTEQLTRQLRREIAELSELKGKTSKLEARIFANAYTWVEQIREQDKNLTHLERALSCFASTFKVSTAVAKSYYYSGRYMAENELDAKVVDHRSVQLAQTSQAKMSKANRLKTLNAVRKGEGRSKVATIVRRAVHDKVTAADRKAKRLDKSNDLTAERIKLEAMALLTLARKFYGDDADLSVEVRVNGRTRVKAT